MDAKNASWTIRKIINARRYLERAAVRIEEAVVDWKFSIRRMYNMLRGELPKIRWKKMICNNQESLKWVFILFLAIQERLYTKDRLIKWGMWTDPACALCEDEQESHQHLCRSSAKVWLYILKWLGINRNPMD